jgi:hypothetical protein
MSVLARSVNERRSSRTASPSSDGKPNGASRTDLDSERVEPISTRSESNRSHAVGVESESALRVPLMRNTLLGISAVGRSTGPLPCLPACLPARVPGSFLPACSSPRPGPTTDRLPQREPCAESRAANLVLTPSLPACLPARVPGLVRLRTTNTACLSTSPRGAGRGNRSLNRPVALSACSSPRPGPTTCG